MTAIKTAKNSHIYRFIVVSITKPPFLVALFIMPERRYWYALKCPDIMGNGMLKSLQVGVPISQVFFLFAG